MTVVTREELSMHKTSKDCWIVVHGRVFNVTEFLAEHPGGPEVICSISGDDVTTEFEDVGHSDTARKSVGTYYVGQLEGAEVVGKEEKTIPSSNELRNKSSTHEQGFCDTRILVFAGVLGVIASMALYFLYSNPSKKLSS